MNQTLHLQSSHLNLVTKQLYGSPVINVAHVNVCVSLKMKKRRDGGKETLRGGNHERNQPRMSPHFGDTGSVIGYNP